MKRSFLALSIVAVISGCGGGDSSEDTVSVVTYSGKILDTQYISGAEVCLDFDSAEACSSGYTTTTDSDGTFGINVAETALSEAQSLRVTARVSSAVASSRAGFSAASAADEEAVAYTLVSPVEQQTLVVSPFTTQVTDKMQINATSRDGLVLDTQIALAKKDVLDQNGFTASESGAVFGDYIRKNDRKLQERAEKAAAWQARAALLRAQYVSNGALKEWDTVKAFVWNTWQHTYHTNRYFERYEEYVMLTKQDGTDYIEAFEGSQWMVDENGDRIPGAKLSDYSESSTWGDGTVEGYGHWRYDDNQDGIFGFEGERAYSGTYRRNDDGLLVINQLEFFNEGNPIVEGGHNEEGREFCPDFDVVSALRDYEDGDVLPSCIDFVQGTVNEDTTEAGNLYTNEEARFYFKQGDSVDMSFVGHYEVREFLSGINGEVGSDIYKDWNGKSLFTDEVMPNPYNEISKNYIDADGLISQERSAANWVARDLNFTIENSPLRLFAQVNYAAWGGYGAAFVHENYEQGQAVDHFRYSISPTSNKTVYDPNSGRTVNWHTPALDADGEVLVYAMLDAEWNKSDLVYEADTVFYPIADSAEYEMSSSQGPVEEIAVTTRLTYQSEGSMFADKQEAVNGVASTAVTFTPAIYSDVVWTVSAPSIPSDLFGYLFGDGVGFTFEKQRAVSKVEGSDLCWDQNDIVMSSQLVSEFGGDMVLTMFCNQWWINDNYYADHSSPGQWIMSVDTVNQDGSFDASLKVYGYGANVLIDEPMQSYPVTFGR